MVGAPALVARAALRAGAGLAKVLAPEPVLDTVLSLIPSATGRALPVDERGDIVPHLAAEIFDDAADQADALVVGPGLGRGDGARALVHRVMGQPDRPVIADADALTLLAATPDFALDLRAPAVLTPHPGEFARLAAALRIDADPVNPDARPAAAERLAQRLGCVVVLKGAGTVVTDGLRTWVCERGHACLATAGTGDVLAGLIAGLIAQFVPSGPRAIGSVTLAHPPGRPLDLFDAARLGVQAHALAGEQWASSGRADAGLLAEELADGLSAVLTLMRR
jgi:NAD(P)H-hydrate epimerase